MKDWQFSSHYCRKPMIPLLLLLLLFAPSGRAEDCSKGNDWPQGGYSQYQPCRIANALERLVEIMEEK